MVYEYKIRFKENKDNLKIKYNFIKKTSQYSNNKIIGTKYNNYNTFLY
jgi:hypothetical protein